MGITVKYAKLGTETGKRIAERVTDIPGDAVLSWGLYLPDEMLPTLNAMAGYYQKLDQLNRFKAAGVPIPDYVSARYVTREFLQSQRAQGTWIARNLTHMYSDDVMLVRRPEDFTRAVSAGRAFFTRFVETPHEYRVVVFRDKLLGVYAKTLTYPERNQGICKDWKNGWTFVYLESRAAPRGLVDVAIKATKVVKLDIGGVDILRTGSESRPQYHVLEVNSAPALESRRTALTRLVEELGNWVRGGYQNAG